jgi:hypothetical protein
VLSRHERKCILGAFKEEDFSRGKNGKKKDHNALVKISELAEAKKKKHSSAAKSHVQPCGKKSTL